MDFNNYENNGTMNNNQTSYQQSGNYYNGNSNVSVYNTYKLVLKRKKAFVASLITFNIYIDNEKVGKIKNGQTVEFAITGGSHTIAIHNKNNAVNLVINGNTTAEVVVFGANNFGITNINGNGIPSFNNVDDNIFLQAKNRTNALLYSSITLPIISIIMVITIGRFITAWLYAADIGYAIVNISGLKNQNIVDNTLYKSLLTKNIVSIVISFVMMIITIYATIFLK